MKKGILHKIQDQILKVYNPYTFLSVGEIDKLVDKLVDDVNKSKFKPSRVVGILSGAKYVSEKVGLELDIPVSFIDITHYHIKLGKMDINELVGVYRIAKILGYPSKIELVSDVKKRDILGEKILLLDDDSYSGRTLEVALNSIKNKEPKSVKTGVIISYKKNDLVDFFGKGYSKRKFYQSKFRMPWSKMSPFYEKSNF